MTIVTTGMPMDDNAAGQEYLLVKREDCRRAQSSLTGAVGAQHLHSTTMECDGQTYAAFYVPGQEFTGEAQEMLRGQGIASRRVGIAITAGEWVNPPAVGTVRSVANSLKQAALSMLPG